MHKVFYASGFLFHLPTQQILLQLNGSSVYWSLFGGEKKNSHNPKAVFQSVVYEHLHIKLLQQAIHSVYDYMHPLLGKNHFIFYAEIAQARSKFKLKKDHSVKWFTFRQLYKLPLTEQTKHDITIGQRVVDALAREVALQKENSLVNKS